MPSTANHARSNRPPREYLNGAAVAYAHPHTGQLLRTVVSGARWSRASQCYFYTLLYGNLRHTSVSPASIVGPMPREEWYQPATPRLIAQARAVLDISLWEVGCIPGVVCHAGKYWACDGCWPCSQGQGEGERHWLIAALRQVIPLGEYAKEDADTSPRTWMEYQAVRSEFDIDPEGVIVECLAAERAGEWVLTGAHEFLCATAADVERESAQLPTRPASHARASL